MWWGTQVEGTGVPTGNWLPAEGLSKPHKPWHHFSCLFTGPQHPWIIFQAIESKQVFSGIVRACFSFLPSAFNRMLFICWKRNPLASVKCLISSALLTTTSANVCSLFPPSEVYKNSNNKSSWDFLEDFKCVVAIRVLIFFKKSFIFVKMLFSHVILISVQSIELMSFFFF